MRFLGIEEHVDVAVLVVTYNSAADIERLIASLRDTNGLFSIRLIVIDNDSSDDTANIVHSQPDVILFETGANLGYAAGINLGIARTGDCDYILILNADLVVMPDAVVEMVAAAKSSSVGAVVPLLLNYDDSICHSLHREPTVLRHLCDAVFSAKLASKMRLPSLSDMRTQSYRYPHDVECATGAAMLLPHQVIREVGRWNESFFLYSEEVEYCRRIRDRGLKIRFEPQATVRHRGGGSGGSPDLSALMAVNRIRYIETYHEPLYAIVFRASVLLGLALRSYRKADRRAFRFVANRSSWSQLPSGKWH